MAFDLGLLIGFLLMPESPSFLARHNRFDESRKSLARLRGLSIESKEIEDEMVIVHKQAEADNERGNVSWKECFSTEDRILWRVMIGVCVQIGQQITGINFFFS
jgi:hypothetical protein